MKGLTNKKPCLECSRWLFKSETNPWNWEKKKFCNRDCKEKYRAKIRFPLRRTRINMQTRERENYRKRLQRKNPLYKEKELIRAKTYYKYGKFKGWVYHHFNPYHIDNWILVKKEEHSIFDRRWS